MLQPVLIPWATKHRKNTLISICGFLSPERAENHSLTPTQLQNSRGPSTDGRLPPSLSVRVSGSQSLPYSLSPFPSPTVIHVSEGECVSDRRTPPASQQRGVRGRRQGEKEGKGKQRKRKEIIKLVVMKKWIIMYVCIHIIQMTADLKFYPLYHQKNLQNHASLLVPSTSNTHTGTHTDQKEGRKGDMEVWRVKTAQRKKDRTPSFVTAEL